MTNPTGGQVYLQWINCLTASCAGPCEIQGPGGSGGAAGSCSGKPTNAQCPPGGPMGSCASPLPLAKGQSFDGTLWGPGVTQGTCGGGEVSTAAFCGNGPESVFRYTVEKPAMLHVKVSASAPDFSNICADGLVPAVYARTSCEQETSEIACTTGYGPSTTELPVTVKTPGDVYLFVDALYGDHGAYTIVVDEQPLCVEKSDCTQAGYPACDKKLGMCVECTNDLDCASKPGKSACEPFLYQCHCGSPFDCEPSKPACQATTSWTCTASGPPCIGDDAAEPADNSPFGATALTLDYDVALTIGDHKFCSNPFEFDWFRFDLSDGDTLDAAVSEWSIRLTDAHGRMVADDVSSHPAALKATHLPAGTYYLSVIFGNYPSPQMLQPYTLSLKRSKGSPCKGVADCAKDWQHQTFRGRCDAPTGACFFVDGKGGLPVGAVCDTRNDCESGLCSYSPFTADADTHGVCVEACPGNGALCAGGVQCRYVDGGPGCPPKCTATEQCPVNGGNLPGSYGALHSTCNTSVGTCG